MRGRRLSALQRERVVRRAVSRIRFQALERAAEAPGFATAAGNLIAELQRTLVTPQRFAAAMRAWAPRTSAAAPTPRTSPRSTGVRPRARARSGVSTPSCTRGVRSTRCGGAGRVGRGPGVLLRLRRPAPARARRGRDALARGRGAGDRVAHLRGGARGARRPGRGGRGAAPAGDRGAASCRRSTSTTTTRRGPRFTTSSAICSSRSRPPSASIRATRCGCSRPAASAPRPSSSRPRCSSCCERGPGRGDRRRLPLARDRGVGDRARVRAYGIAIAVDRQVPFGAHRARTRSAGAGALRAAGRPGAGGGPACDYLRTPGLLERPELADGLEAERAPREGLRSAAQARERLGWTLGEIDALRGGGRPAARAGVARPVGCSPRPTAGAPRCVDPAEELDAHALASMLRGRWRSSPSSASDSPGAELIELLEGAGRCPTAAPARRGAVLVADPLAIRARRFRGGVRVRPAGGRVPAGRPRPSRSCPTSGAASWPLARGLRLRPRRRAGARALPVLRLHLARHSRAARAELPQLRRGGQPGAAVAVRRRRRRAARPDWPDRRRRRLLADVVWPPNEAPTARELARTEAAARAPLVGRRSSAAAARCPTARCATSATARSCRPARWRPTATARSSGWSSASCARRGSSPTRIRSCAAATSTSVLERGDRRLGTAVTPQTLPDALGLLDDGARANRRRGSRPVALEGVRAGGAARDRSRPAPLPARTRRGDGSAWEPSAARAAVRVRGRGGLAAGARAGAAAGTVRLRGAIDRVDVDPGGSRAIVRDYKSGQRAPDYQGARWQRRAPAAGRAVHARGARAARARAGRPASTSRSPATTCARAACSSSDADVGSRLVDDRRARRASSCASELEDADARGRSRWPRGCAPASSTPRPHDLLARRLPLPGHLPQPMIACDEEPVRCRTAPSGPRAARRDRAPRGRPAARRRRRQRQDVGAGRALRARGARGRRRGRARSSRSRSPRRRRRSCASGSARACARSGPTSAARATEGAFISTIHGFCARRAAHARARGGDRSAVRRCSTSPRRERLADAAFDEALDDLARERARRRRPDRRVHARATLRDGIRRRARRAALARRGRAGAAAAAAARTRTSSRRRATALRRARPRLSRRARRGRRSRRQGRAGARAARPLHRARSTTSRRRAVARRARRAAACPAATAPR